MNNVKLISAVLCEEVRREYTGGAIIIGARPSGQPVPTEQDTIIPRLALYIELEVKWPTPSSVSVRLRNEEEEYNLLEYDFELDHPNDSAIDEEKNRDADEVRGVLVSVLNEENVLVKGPGIFSVQLKCDGDGWDTVREYIFPTQSDETAKD